jgi:catechol 2,3-dioxygenase-like lactoylglutathione lyase family enzyme
MDIKKSSTALFVEDLNRSKIFYSQILGLEIDLDFGKNIIYKAGFAIWEIQKDHIIPAKLGVDNLKNESAHRFELYFETENITETFNILKNNNIRFLHDIHEEIWGQQTIRFFDPDYHLIEIGESMNQFINRFYKRGFSVEQISERTSVSKDYISSIISNS